MLEAIKKVNDRLASIEYFILVILFATMLILMLTQVIFRYFLQIPLGWSEEMARYLYVTTTFLGAVIAVKEREHIEINFISIFINKFKDNPVWHKRLIKIANLFRDVVAIIFLSFVAQQTWYFAVDQYVYQLVSTATNFPMYILSGSVFVSCCLMIIHYIFLIILNQFNTGLTGYEAIEEE